MNQISVDPSTFATCEAPIPSVNTLSPFPHHVTELRASGLTEETIRAAGIRSEHDRRKLASMLNRKSWSQQLGSALVFPYRDAAGTVVQTRVKPDQPQQQYGKAAKYLSPSGATVRVYFPPGTHRQITDGAVEIIITEGEKKSLKASQDGFCCVGLPGVDCWHGRQSTSLLADLENIHWPGRTVFIAFDSDAALNARVRESESRLAAVLKRRGAVIKVVRLPAKPNGDKVGLDDFLVAHGPSELRKLLDHADDPVAPEPDSLKSSASEADPADIAAKLLASCECDGVPRLRFWRGSFWWWQHGRYVEKPDLEVRAEVLNQFTRDWFGVKGRHVSDVMEHLRATTLVGGDFEPAAWFGNTMPAGFRADECLPTKSQVVHLPSLAARHEPSTVDATPAFFTLNATDFDLDLNAPRPAMWLWFLEALWGDDQQSIDTLQELFGYLLTSDTRQQKIFLLVGPKRSGKGTIARVLTSIIGKANVAAPTLAGLSTNFGLWPLIGKSAAIISDARLSGRADQVAVVERLLTISGEDSITIDRKNLEPVTCRLSSRFVILTNELPRLSDASGAVVSRMILLQLTKSFFGYEDPDLTDKLLSERDGILLWAIEGWCRLHKRGRFIQPDSAFESLADMDDLASPIKAFVRDCCVVGPTESVSVGDVYEAWEQWCVQERREKYASTVQTFARDLMAAVPSARRKRVREGDGRVRIYEGIGLRSGF